MGEDLLARTRRSERAERPSDEDEEGEEEAPAEHQRTRVRRQQASNGL